MPVPRKESLFRNLFFRFRTDVPVENGKQSGSPDLVSGIGEMASAAEERLVLRSVWIQETFRKIKAQDIPTAFELLRDEGICPGDFLCQFRSAVATGENRHGDDEAFRRKLLKFVDHRQNSVCGILGRIAGIVRGSGQIVGPDVQDDDFRFLILEMTVLQTPEDVRRAVPSAGKTGGPRRVPRVNSESRRNPRNG